MYHTFFFSGRHRLTAQHVQGGGTRCEVELSCWCVIMRSPLLPPPSSNVLFLATACSFQPDGLVTGPFPEHGHKGTERCWDWKGIGRVAWEGREGDGQLVREAGCRPGHSPWGGEYLCFPFCGLFSSNRRESRTITKSQGPNTAHV